jgi:hypothetical protein
MATHKRWSDLTGTQRKLIYVAGAAEALMTAAALRDLAGRPAEDVRGPKLAWVLACVVQPVGPLAYFAVGRR